MTFKPATWLPIAVLTLLANGVSAQEPPRRGTSIPVILTAVGGSFAGVAGGAWFGGQMSESLGIGQGGEDPGQLLRILGAGAGSVLGTALGAEFGNRLMGGEPVSLGAHVRDAGVGIFFGLAVGYLSAKIAEPDAGKGWRIGYSSAQGLYAGLSNGRW